MSRSDIFAPLMKQKYQEYQDKEVVSRSGARGTRGAGRRGALCIVSCCVVSWGRRAADVGENMTPLHAGGILARLPVVPARPLKDAARARAGEAGAQSP